MNTTPHIPAARPLQNVLPPLDRMPVKSSSIRSIGYDPATQHLQVEFKQGGTYDYPGVPPLLHSQFLQSKSKGTFAHEVLRTRFRSVKRV